MQEISISEQKAFDNKSFPLVLTPPDDVNSMKRTLEYLKNNMNSIMDKLLQHGAILFRNFPVENPSDFNDFALSFGWNDLPYIGGAAVRRNIVGVVFTSNESPPDQQIPFHHEMAQVPKFPSYLFFYCDLPAQEGGETPICLSNVVYERIKQEEPEFVDKLSKLGVRYTRILPDGDDPSSAIGRGWQSTYLTNIREEAEEKCRAQGGECEWLPDGCLKTVTKVMPAVRLDERTGKWTWFNSIVAAFIGWKDSRNDPRKAITFGDGTPLDPEIIEKCDNILQENCVSFKWEKNDVVLIDNRLVLHARKSFIPPRRILAALFE